MDYIFFHYASCDDELQQIKNSQSAFQRVSTTKEGLVLFLGSELRGYNNVQTYLAEKSNDFTITLFRGSKVSKLFKELHSEVESHKKTIAALSRHPVSEYYVSLGLLKAYRTTLHVLVAVFNIRANDFKDYENLDEAIAEKIRINTGINTEEE